MMKRLVTILISAFTLAFSAVNVSASIPAVPQVKAAVVEKLNTTSPNTVHNFSVMDASGVLLTCAKQQIDSDTFSGCVLAPGRTLDDLMTSIVRTIHAEQNKEKTGE
jgi:hypothetical protein